MPRIEIVTQIRAPVTVVFDLARSIDAHQASQSRHHERAVAGRTSGLIEADETVTWEAVHFGVRQRLSSRIAALERPRFFRDSMIKGAFARIDHDHFFEATNRGTLMKDVFDYTAPLGWLGRIADALFLKRYMKSLLEERNLAIKRIAESGDFAKYISGAERAHGNR